MNLFQSFSLIFLCVFSSCSLNQQIEKEEISNLPPYELIQGNIQETELSADVTFLDCSTSEDLIPYVTYTCTARVNEIYSFQAGKTLERFTIATTREVSNMEEGAENLNEKRFLVSVDSHNQEDGTVIWNAPDTAYIFTYSEPLVNIFREISEKEKQVKNFKNVPSCDNTEEGMQCAM